ncbi:helix-turn-helix domain-containing protein [Ruegeria lacuscaerulensis]|uniref:helix-turn-helix domain-containing protein n=1 Tax=Ruegeria lacuscaerulensis TaxID=55218 RepID=UPI00147A3656|nr:helix-turn-helix domain-containing protein [Ruegeria lacuscaerulensis]
MSLNVNTFHFDSFDLWTEKMWRFSSPMIVHCENPNAFKGFSKTWELGDLGMTFFSAPPYQAEQTDVELSKAQRKRLVLTIPTSGRCEFNQFGRYVELGPGDAVFHVTRSPMVYTQREPTTAWLISIPLKTALMHVDDPEEICAVLISEATPGFRTLRALLSAMPDDVPNLSDAARDIFVHTSIEMICAIITQMRGDASSRRSQIARQRLRQIKGYIDRHLGDIDLTPTRVADDHSISPRYLHYLFSTEGQTVSKYVLNRRLEESALFITRNKNKKLDAGDVGYRFGFANSVQFRRAFSRKYGTTPSKYLKLTLSAQ